MPSSFSADGPLPGLPRERAVDVLRALAMTLGVFFHGTVAYLARPVAGLLWPVHDGSSSLGFDLLFWWSHGFRIPLFFLLSGFLARRSLARHGSRVFALGRTRRLLIPFAVSSVTVLVAVYYVWAWGFLVSGRATTREVLAVKFRDPSIQTELFGPAHLWFLLDLYVLALAGAGLAALRGARGAGRAGDDVTGPAASPLFEPVLLSPVVWALPAAGLLLASPRLLTGFHNGFAPDPLRLAYNGLFFGAGAWLAGSLERLSVVAARGPIWLAASVPFLALLLAALGSGSRTALGLSGALFAWLSSFGFLGLALRWTRTHPDPAAEATGSTTVSAALNALAEASYWVYLVHLPIVGLGQVLLFEVPLPAGVKYAAVTGSALLLSLASWRLVRGTGVGKWLSGLPRPEAAP